MDSLEGLTDCVFRNVAITIIFLFVIEAMAVLISLRTVEGCFTGKTVVQLQDPIRITTTPDELILVTDYKAKKKHILK